MKNYISNPSSKLLFVFNYSKFLIIAIISITFTSCSENINFDNINDGTSGTNTTQTRSTQNVNEIINEGEAIIIAQNFFRYEAEYKTHEYINKDVQKVTSLSDPTSTIPLLHIIEFTKGFCIVSADTRYEPILAYSEENQWGGADLDGPNVMLNLYKSRIKDIKKTNEKQPEFLKGIWKRLLTYEQIKATEDKKLEPRNSCTYGECRPDYCESYYNNTVGPFVHPVARWSQAESFTLFSPNDNNCSSFYCVKSPAGCGPIALGMLMRYHESPIMNMSFNGVNSYTDYSSMPITRGTCSQNTGSFLSSAMLVRLCGSAMNSIYGVSGSCNTATIPANISNGLNFFGYTHNGLGSLSSRYSAINNDLVSEFPVILTGATNSIGADWHIWLADGYKQFHYESWTDNGTCNGDPYYGSHPYYCGVCPSCINCSIFAATQWHMNWGWNGTSNGWYAASPYSIGDYDSLMHAYTNIRP
ncbi:MAG: C10 family peptidase [Saprospiraceae bacterium]